jgi:putative SOS response-associated peptidase YedK
MCGRYILAAPPEAVASHFALAEVPVYAPRYNIAPTQVVPVVRETPEGARECVLLRWGLIPSWARDPDIGQRLINARAEGVADKPSFRAAFRKRRCLVPATGFYEWKRAGTRKQPYLVQLEPDGLFAMAGLWERWRSPEGVDVATFTIVTTDASPALQGLHERMPVIVAPADYDEWLSSPNPSALLGPWGQSDVRLVPVSTRVNSVRNDDPTLVAPVAAGE